MPSKAATGCRGQLPVVLLLGVVALALLTCTVIVGLPGAERWELHDHPKQPGATRIASNGGLITASLGADGQGLVGQSSASALGSPCEIPRDPRDASPEGWPPRGPALFTNLTEGWRARRAWRRGAFLRKFAAWRQPLSTFLRDPWLQFVGRGAELAESPVEVSFEEYLAVLAATRRNVFLFARNREAQAQAANPIGRQAMRRRFFEMLAEDYRVPRGFQQKLQIFAMDGLATGHGMHRHKEAWLAQVAGRKVWWLAPPSASEVGAPNSTVHPRFPYKALSVEEGSWPCAWLLRRDLVPIEAPVFQCTQQPGEVLVLPAGWWHATCSLDNFNVAIGGQGE